MPLDVVRAARAASEVRAADDPTLGTPELRVAEDSRRYGASMRGGRLVTLARRDDDSPDQRVDRLVFDDEHPVCEVPLSHLPDWATDH